MIIDFTRTGGVGGVKFNIVINTDTLPLEEITKLSDLLEPFRHTTQPSGMTTHIDRFSYSIRIDGGKRLILSEVNDKELIDYLMNKIRHQN